MHLLQTKNKENLTFTHKGLYLSWIAGSNQWLLMQRPAWITYDLMVNQCRGLLEVIGQLTNIFDYSHDEALKLIREVEGINTMALQNVESPKTNLHEITKQTNLTYQYRFNAFDKNFLIKYDDERFYSYLFSSFIKLKNEYTQIPDVEFNIYKEEDIFYLADINTGTIKAFEDLSFLKGRLHLEILNHIENKTDNDWLSVVHAAAVSNGKRTLLFVADSGKGKSTLTALLHAKGYSYISDDMVAIDRISGTACAVPYAISVKPGAVELLSKYFKDLSVIKPLVINGTGKEVRYLFPQNQEPIQKTKVSNIIYLEYNSKTEFEIEELDFVESLQRYNSEAWIVPEKENVLEHLTWLSNTPAYRMTYSDSNKAIENCINLLESEP